MSGNTTSGASAVPFAMCSSSLAPEHPNFMHAGSMTIVTTPTLQSSESSNIIVLNIGNTNGLATALTQLVSSNIIPQPQAQKENVPSCDVAKMVQRTTEGTLPQISVPVDNKPSCSVSLQMGLQDIQARQQQPAAFMLVPIPQFPSPRASVQNIFPNICSQQHHQSPLLFTFPGHIAESNSLKAQVTDTQDFNRSLSALPKSDELRAFLTETSTVDPTTQTRANIIPNQQASTCQSFLESPSRRSSINCAPAGSLLYNTKIARHGNKVAHNITPNHDPTVSSPGLAFLAQVSSLASPDQKTLAATNTFSVGTLTPPGISQEHTTPEVNNNTLILALREEMKGMEKLEPTRSTAVLSTTDCSALENQKLPAAIGMQSDNDVVQESDFQIQGVAGKRKKEMPLSSLIKEKKKKGPAPKLSGNEVCLICGDRASGFHYNTLSCEGCKGFFRRSVFKAAKYHCKLNGDCTMDLYMRRKCQKCRFEKCKAVGMREESVLSEEKVRAKKMKKDAEPTQSPMMGVCDDSLIPKLTPQQRSLLELLKANERRFQWPTLEDVKKVTVWVEGDDTTHSRALRFAHFTEMCILIVQLVVEFTKQLPGFLTVPREDQIVLLKACAIEVMLLRAAKQYNRDDGTINFLNGKLYNKSSFYRAGMQVEFVDPIFQFCNSMAQLDLDETEYAILVAINTFSADRPHIKDREKVECMQDPYVELLRVYSRIRHPDDPVMFARILMKIVELRTLNNYHSEQIFALKVQDRKLPPLLAEIWDM